MTVQAARSDNMGRTGTKTEPGFSLLYLGQGSLFTRALALIHVIYERVLFVFTYFLMDKLLSPFIQLPSVDHSRTMGTEKVYSDLDDHSVFRRESLKYNAAPPPLTNKGESYSVIFKPQAGKGTEFIKQCLPAEMRSLVPGNPIPVVSLIRYTDSPVGPYDELLFVPTVLEKDGTRFSHCTHMFVSENASVMAGRQKWGFPKLLSRFEWSVSKRIN